MIAALEHRVEQIEASARANEFAMEGIESSPDTPDTVVERFRLTQARLDGEAGWARGLIERLRAGGVLVRGRARSALERPRRPLACARG